MKTRVVAVSLFFAAFASAALAQNYLFTTLAGQTGTYGSVDGTGPAARFNGPVGVAVTSAGNIYLVEANNATVRMVTPLGVVTTVATLPRAGSGVAVDAAGNMFISDEGLHVIRKVTPTGVVSVFAGESAVAGSANGSLAEARFNGPRGLAFDSAGNLLVTEMYNHTVRKIAPDGTVSTIAGLAGVEGSVDGTGPIARFRRPSGIVVEAGGTIYVADSGNYNIRKISGGIVTTLAGSGSNYGIADGVGPQARFVGPAWLARDNAGNLFVSDGPGWIRKVTVAGVVTTIGGDSSTGATDGVGTAARFSLPLGLAVAPDGTIFIADNGNQLIRRGAALANPVVTTQPQSVTVAPAATATFGVGATSSRPISYQWQRQAAGTAGFLPLLETSAYAGVTTTTLKVTTTTAMNGDQFRCVVDNGSGETVASSSVTLGVTLAPAFTSANAATFYVGLSGTFSVRATGSPAPTYSVVSGSLPGWATLNAATGVISGTPLPSDMSTSTFTLSAANGVGSPATQVFTLSVQGALTAPTVISSSGSRQVIMAGQQLSLVASGSGSAPLTYQWKRNGMPIAAATNAVYSVPSASAGDAGWYQAVVTNPAGASTSPVMFVNIAYAQTRVVSWGTTNPVFENLTNAMAIAGGAQHALALKSDGTLVTWGSGSEGQTVVPMGVYGSVAIAVGAYHNLVLLSDGTVAGWGADYSGQATVPAGLSGVVAIAAGYTHSLALKADGTVVAWGSNSSGQCSVPAGLRNAIAIAAGDDFSVALKADGTVVTWGSSPLPPDSPVTNVTAIAAGDSIAVVVHADGTVDSWGSYAGSIPVGLAGVRTVALAYSRGIALKTDGTLVAWGSSTSPATGLRSVIAVSAGWGPSMALRDASADRAPTFVSSPVSTSVNLGGSATFTANVSAGTAPLNYQWCRNGVAIPDATNAAYTVAAVSDAVAGSYSVVASNALGSTTAAATLAVNTVPVVGADLGGRYPLVIGQNLTLSVAPAFGPATTIQWRRNSRPISGATGRTYSITNAQLSDGGYYQAVYDSGAGPVVSAAVFVPVTPAATQLVRSNDTSASMPTFSSPIVALSSWSSSTAAVCADGTITQWSNDYYSSTFRPPITNAVGVAATGSSSTCWALLADGTVVRPGSSSWDTWTPPPGLRNVVAISGTSTHALALKGDGTVMAWGTSTSATAVPSGLANVVAVAAGDGFSLALRGDGTVVGWGANQYGQSTVPTGFNNVTAIVASGTFSMALKGDGTVVAWGHADDSYSYVTRLPAGLNGVVAITAGPYHAYALKSDGSLVGWGTYAYYSSQSVPPVAVPSVIAMSGTSATTYFVRDASRDTVPVITTQPLPVSLYVNQSATLAVEASAGTATLKYQWRKAGIAIPGATLATLAMDYAGTDASGSYDVVVSDQLGSTVSNTVVVAVSPTRAVTVTPAGRQAVAAGQTLTLTGSTAMPGVTSYQWLRNGLPVAGATNAVLSLPNIQFATGGRYQLAATNSVGIAISLPTYVGVTGSQAVVGWGSSTSGAASVPMSGIHDVVQVAAGLSHSLALSADGTIAAWGSNSSGQCTVPVLASDVVAVAAGREFSMALSADGRVTTWGRLNYAPPEVGTAVAIAASPFSDTAMALRVDGTVVAWSTYGSVTNVPVGLSRVIAISRGSSVALALRSDGTIVQWGDSNAVPVPATVTRVVGIAVGGSHSLALREDGSVVAWGLNGSGQTNVPIGLANVIAVAAGETTSFAVKSDGTVASWGSTGYWEDRTLIAGAEFVRPAMLVAIGSGFGLALRNPATDSAPTITAISADTVVQSGQQLVLSVTATCVPPPSYQWYRDGLAIQGATSATYTNSSVSLSSSGKYTVTVSNPLGAVTSANVVVGVKASSSLRGILASSARMNVGAAPAFGTFVVEGSEQKSLLIRGVGPALVSLGVADNLANPKLTVWNANTETLFSNDDWGMATNASQLAYVASQVGAFGLPANSKDAAVGAVFDPGAYHAWLSAASGGGSTAMLQVYDADTDPRLVYVATRAFAGGGNNVFVQGLSLAQPPVGRSYLVRAIGPSLGIPGALSDPQIAIYDSAGVQLAANDDWSGSAAMTALVTSAGAQPLQTAARDAAVEFVPPGPGAFSIQVKGAAGTSGIVLVEVLEIDAQRSSVVAPAFSSPPADTTVAVGGSVVFTAFGIAKPVPSYQWRKNGGAIPGATDATFTLTNAQPSDAASYSVMATNSGGTATSAAAVLTVASHTGSHAVVGNGYVAGSTATITNTLRYSGAPSSLGWQVTLPPGWTFASSAGSVGDVSPAVGATGTLEWAWSLPTPTPIVFSYTVNVPAGESGTKNIAANAIVRVAGTAETLTVAPAALAVDAAPNVHSADTNADLHLGLLELTRVIELYNTRNGSSRTGCYSVAVAATEDGYAPDSTRANSATVTLTRYHTADPNHDGKIGLFELTRVIELYNYRSTNTRTGEYHLQAGTEDGFAPGP